MGSPVTLRAILVLVVLAGACSDAATSGGADGAMDVTPPDGSQDGAGDVAEDSAPDGAADVASDPVMDIAPDANPDWWADPIEAETDTWQWVPIDGAVCGDGSPTGLGINLHPGATRALIYLEGGGACWDYGTCDGLIQTSFHLGGYDEASFFGLFNSVYLATFFFDRDDDHNPFRDAHHVFIPYCTGDCHAGDNVVELAGLFPWQSSTMHFKGHANMKTFLTHLVPTFQGVDRVVVAGASAGGIGAAVTWPTVQQAFGDVRVDVIDDSGPPVQPGADRWKAWQEAWNIQLPEPCDGCSESIEAVVENYRANLMTTNRFALMSHARDAIISTFMALLPFQFKDRLYALCDVLDEEPNAQYFIIPGSLHILTLIGSATVEAEDGTPLWQWLQQMLDDDPAWQSYRP